MPEIKRKIPTQARAQQTVGIILEAAAQILQFEGEAHFNTNRVAEKAGFSIGTLYQYFPRRSQGSNATELIWAPHGTETLYPPQH
ncbi:hypothetical protein LBMAG20_18560 [Methylocystaceae bacterium]|nr:hypothetical protein LBMAG20_18560 [Methylocystaceae bacterium]